MAIILRYGSYTDFDPTKMRPAEAAVVGQDDPHTTDGSSAYVATKAGDVKRIAFAQEVDDVRAAIEDGYAQFTDPQSNGNIVITQGSNTP